jgi:hypothetical protein
MTKALTAEASSNLIVGTSLCGYIRATRAEIEKVFGAPTYGVEHSGDGKVTTEWVIDFGNEVIATIYDWKRYEQGAPEMDERIVWNIGGRSHDALIVVGLAMNTTTFVNYPFDIFGAWA